MPLLDLIHESADEPHLGAYLEWHRAHGHQLGRPGQHPRRPDYEENLRLYNRDKAVRERGQF